MQIHATTDITVRTLADGKTEITSGRTKAVVSLDPSERFVTTEAWGSRRRFSPSAFSVTLGSGMSHATGSGVVVKKDGHLGTARVTSTSFPLTDAPEHVQAEVQRVLFANVDAARRVVQTTPEA